MKPMNLKDEMSEMSSEREKSWWGAKQIKRMKKALPI